jgi:hypothetical protein
LNRGFSDGVKCSPNHYIEFEKCLEKGKLDLDPYGHLIIPMMIAGGSLVFVLLVVGISYCCYKAR